MRPVRYCVDTFGAARSISPGALGPEWPPLIQMSFVGTFWRRRASNVAVASLRLKRVSLWPCSSRVGTRTFET